MSTGMELSEITHEKVHEEDVSKGTKSSRWADRQGGSHLRDTSPKPEALGTELPKNYYRSPKFLGSVTAAALSALSAYLGWVLPANVLSVINEDIGPSANVNWVAISYTLCNAISATMVGRLSDIFGRRWFFIIGNTLAIIASILGCTAQSVNQLIAAGAFTGFAATVQLAFPILLGELVPMKRRAQVNGFIFLCCLPISAFGTIIARSFVQHTAQSWRWNYYLNLITSTLCVVLYFFFYHPPQFHLLHSKRSKWDEIKSLDFGGLILFGSGLLLLLLGLSWGGQAYPWKSAHVIATTVVGGITLIMFGIYETFMPLTHPLIPMSLFKNRRYVTLVMCATVCSMIYYSINIIWPGQIASLFTTDSVEIGWLSCTIGAGTVFGQVTAGAVTKRIGRLRWQLVTAEACVTAFIGSLAAVNASKRSLAIAGTFLGSFFVGYVELVTLTCAPMTCSPEDIGLATGLLSSIRSAGGAIATAIYVTILNNKLATNIPKDVSKAAISNGLPASSLTAFMTAITTGNSTALASVPGATSTVKVAAQSALLKAYSDSYSVVYYATIAFGCAAVIAAFCTSNMDDAMTNEVARKLQGIVKNDVESEKNEVAKIEEV